MSRRCDKCGKQARRLVPVITRAYPADAATDPKRPIPRSALRILGLPEPPFGEHPDDPYEPETWCEECARS